MRGNRGMPAPIVIREDEQVVGGLLLIRYATPWVLALTLLLGGVVTHLLWGGGSMLPWITATLAVATVGLSWLGWRVGQTRRLGPAGRAHVAGTIASAGTWLLMATVAGPFTRGVVDLWLVLLLIAPVSWNIRVVLHRAGKSGGEEDAQLTPRKAAKQFLGALGLKGAELDVSEVNEHRIGGRLKLTDGENTVDDVQKKIKNFATALELPRGGVRFTEDPMNVAEADFNFTLRDVLAKSTPWPGPSAIGGTAFDTIPMGLYEIGQKMMKAIADQAGAKHELIQGITGSGKSSGTRVEFCELMTRREVALILIDTEKGTQSFGDAAPGLAWFIHEEKQAEKFLKRLRAVIKARASYLGAKGLDTWRPGCGLTFLVIQIEEAANLLAQIGDEELEQAVKAARSAGIAIKISLQRPSFDQISTTTRGQLGGATCYGMAAEDVVCMLPDEVQDAGANPRQWGDRQPGCCYMVGTGITVAQASTPGRTYRITNEQLKRHAAEWGPRMDPVDALTIRAFGDLWTNRVPPVELVARLNAEALRAAGLPTPADGQAAEPHGDDDPTPGDSAGGDDDEELDVLTPEEMGVTTPDDEPDDTSIDDPITALDCEVRFSEDKPQVSVEEARAAVAERITSFERQGRDTIRVPDLVDLVVKGLRSRGWFRKELMRLVQEGRLVDEGDGQFCIVPEHDDDPEEAAA